MVRVNTWEGLSPKQLRNTYAETALAVEPPDEGWDCLDLVGVKGTADRMLRLGDTFGGLILWSATPDGFVLRCVKVEKNKPATYKTVDLDFLRKSGDRKQNFAGPVVGEL